MIDKLEILVLGQFIPKEELKSMIFDLLGQEEDCEETLCETEVNSLGKVGKERMGSTSLVENFGMMLVFFAIIVVLCALVLLLSLLKKTGAIMKKVVVALKEKLFYNSFIRYSM